ncbi:hypothetical protein OID55_01475 [Streptomyces sp. NBC_00715]|uniref:hypothetical protein n=1 Tax=Streptomyces sp. NBC_00715 TaxID=2975811 RepID=UPI00386BE7F5
MRYVFEAGGEVVPQRASVPAAECLFGSLRIRQGHPVDEGIAVVGPVEGSVVAVPDQSDAECVLVPHGVPYGRDDGRRFLEPLLHGHTSVGLGPSDLDGEHQVDGAGPGQPARSVERECGPWRRLGLVATVVPELHAVRCGEPVAEDGPCARRQFEAVGPEGLPVRRRVLGSGRDDRGDALAVGGAARWGRHGHPDVGAAVAVRGIARPAARREQHASHQPDRAGGAVDVGAREPDGVPQRQPREEVVRCLGPVDGQAHTQYRLLGGPQHIGSLLDEWPAGGSYDEHERPG